MPTEFLILKRGNLEGPFEEDEVRRRLAEGELRESDLGRTAESYYWMPLHKLLGTDPAPATETAAPAEAPEFWVFLADLRERAWIAYLHYPWESGLVLLGVGLFVAIFTFWPILLYGPFMLATLVAGAMLFLRGKTGPGLALCAAAILLPILVVLVLHA
jgi:hypothetical protein